MLPAFAGAEGTFSYTLTAGGTEVEESEPLGQKVHMFDPDIPNSLPAGAQWGNADDPEWQCTLARNMDKDFYDKPVHCQKAYHEEKWLTTYVEKKGNPTAIEQPDSITATVRGETARTISNNVGTLTRKPSNEQSSANSNGKASGPILESSIPSDPDVDLENQSVTVRGGGPYLDDSFVEASEVIGENSPGGCLFHFNIAISKSNPPESAAATALVVAAAKKEITQLLTSAGHRVTFDDRIGADDSYNITLQGGSGTGSSANSWASGWPGTGVGSLWTGYLMSQTSDKDSEVIGTAIGRIIAHEAVAHNFLSWSNKFHTKKGLTRTSFSASDLFDKGSGKFGIPIIKAAELRQACERRAPPIDHV